MIFYRLVSSRIIFNSCPSLDLVESTSGFARNLLKGIESLSQTQIF